MRFTKPPRNVDTGKITNGNPDYLISIGGEDRAVMQWRLKVDPPGTDVLADQEDLLLWKSDMEHSLQTVDEEVEHNALDEAFEFGQAGGGDEFMAVKPWLGAIKAPSHPGKPVPNIQPETDLELRWIHGFNSLRSKNVVHYVAKDAGGGIVYPAATLGVRLRLKEKGGGKETGDPSILKDYEQKYNEDHKDDIVCMAVDEPGNYAASGAAGKNLE